jgi:hypothetical protein
MVPLTKHAFLKRNINCVFFLFFFPKKKKKKLNRILLVVINVMTNDTMGNVQKLKPQLLKMDNNNGTAKKKKKTKVEMWTMNMG